MELAAPAVVAVVETLAGLKLKARAPSMIPRQQAQAGSSGAVLRDSGDLAGNIATFPFVR